MEPILFVTSDGLRRHDPGDDVMTGHGSELASQADAEAVIRSAAARGCTLRSLYCPRPDALPELQPAA